MFSLDDHKRRLGDKRFNERIKLIATGSNGAAIVTFGAAVIAPTVGGSVGLATSVWIIAAVALHLVGQAVLGLLREEG